MSKNNSANALKESLLEFKQIQDMIKENSDTRTKDLVSESVVTGLKKIIAEANDFDEEDVDKEDDENTENEVEDIDTETDDLDVEPIVEPSTEDGADTDLSIDIDDDSEEEDDLDLDRFQSDEDGEYDLTGVDTNTLIKVFKKMTSEDGIDVAELGDGKIELKDASTNAEYVLDTQSVDEDPMIELDLDNDDMGEDVTEEVGLTEEILDADEAGEGEIDEKTMTTSRVANRNHVGVMSQTRVANAPGIGQRKGAQLVDESKQILALKKAYGQKLKEINEENKTLKNALGLFRDKLKENAVLNNNLGRYVKLVTENSTTKEEKVAILNRFAGEAKSIQQGNSLFESIQKELNAKVVTSPLIEKKFTAESTKAINEQVIYQSKELTDMKRLMEKMDKY